MNPKEGAIPASSLELQGEIQRLSSMLQAAHRSSIDIKNSYDFYILALKESHKDNVLDSYLYYDRSKYELTSAINDAKLIIRGSKFHSLRTLSYFFKLYGLYALVFGAASAFLFGILIYRYADIDVLNVPLWSCFFAGLGSSAQILTGLVYDLRQYNAVLRYKRVWYMAIPLLSLIFGYMAYLLFSSVMMAFQPEFQSKTFAIMLICFITGFLTNWLIDRLSQLSRNL